MVKMVKKVKNKEMKKFGLSKHGNFGILSMVMVNFGLPIQP
jgi:hypothetical protein